MYVQLKFYTRIFYAYSGNELYFSLQFMWRHLIISRTRQPKTCTLVIIVLLIEQKQGVRTKKVGK